MKLYKMTLIGVMLLNGTILYGLKNPLYQLLEAIRDEKQGDSIVALIQKIKRTSSNAFKDNEEGLGTAVLKSAVWHPDAWRLVNELINAGIDVADIGPTTALTEVFVALENNKPLRNQIVSLLIEKGALIQPVKYLNDNAMLPMTREEMAWVKELAEKRRQKNVSNALLETIKTLPEDLAKEIAGMTK